MSLNWEDQAENVLLDASRIASKLSQADAVDFYEHIATGCEVSGRAIEEDIEREDQEYEDDQSASDDD